VCCDLRYCSDKSSSAQPAMRYGIGYRYSSLRRLVDIIGVPATKDMLLGGLQFDGERSPEEATGRPRRAGSRVRRLD